MYEGFDRNDETRGNDGNRLVVYGIIAGAVVLGGAGLWWKKHHRHRYVGGAHAVATSASASGSARVIDPGPTPTADDVALEVWVKSPDALSTKLVPPLLALLRQPLPPGTPFPFVRVFGDGMPREAQKDLAALDFSQPLGFVVLGSASPDGNGRFAVAASVRDVAEGSRAVVSYATREGAIKEHSDVLGIDLYRGGKTGRYLGFYQSQVIFSTDKGMLEIAAPRLAQGLPAAKMQSHDVVAHAPRSLLSGPTSPLVAMVQDQWKGWTGPQLGGATSGPAKDLFDEIEQAVRSTWTGANTADATLDVDDKGATLAASAAAIDGSPLGKFLGGLASTSPAVLFDAPRDAMSATALRLPRSWFSLVPRILLTPSPEMEKQLSADDKKKLEEARAKAEAATGKLIAALDGEVLYATVLDPSGAPPATYTRLTLTDEAAAKTVAHDVAQMLFPPNLKATVRPLTLEGGAGEAFEVEEPAHPPLPAMKLGLAWVAKGGFLWVVRGSQPGDRAVQFATANGDGRLSADPVAKAKLAALPAKALAMHFAAPLREGTHLAELAKLSGQPMPTSNDAQLASLESGAGGLSLHVALDLNLALELIAPFLLHPTQPPPGSLPPDAAANAGAPGGQRPMGIPGGLPGGLGMPRAPQPGGGAQRPSGNGNESVVVPPAPTGYVLPLPRHSDR
jgi:hypothetical protein